MQGKTIYIKTSLKEILEDIRKEGIDATEYRSGFHIMQERITHYLDLLKQGKLIIRGKKNGI